VESSAEAARSSTARPGAVARVPAAVTASRTRTVVYAASAAYASGFGTLSILHYLGFGYARFDLGNMTQAVWSTAHGRLLETTGLNGDQISRLGAHTDWFLALLAPLWTIWPSPVLLLVLQVVAVSVGALPVYWLARKHLASERAAAHFAFAYLLYPATQFNTFMPAAGFHAVSLALPLILFAIWFLDEGRLVAFALTAALAATTKEEIAAAVGCLGFWYAFRTGRRAVGATMVGLGAAWTLVNFLLVIPHYSDGLHPFADRYAGVGGTPGGIVRTAVTDPGALLTTVFTTHKAVYLALLFLPLLGFWALEPLLLLGAAPDLVVNLLSSKPDQTTLHYQYTAGIVPFVFAAAIVGAKRLRRDPAELSLYVLAAVGCIAVYSPLWALGVSRDALRADPVQLARAHAVTVAPDAARVSASNNLGSRLSARRFIYVFPHIGDAQWVVVDRNDPTFTDTPANANRYRRAIDRVEQSPRWRTVFAAHGVAVLRRHRG
jgi:uncharacterized membrane protein